MPTDTLTETRPLNLCATCTNTVQGNRIPNWGNGTATVAESRRSAYEQNSARFITITWEGANLGGASNYVNGEGVVASECDLCGRTTHRLWRASGVLVPQTVEIPVCAHCACRVDNPDWVVNDIHYRDRGGYDTCYEQGMERYVSVGREGRRSDGRGTNGETCGICGNTSPGARWTATAVLRNGAEAPEATVETRNARIFTYVRNRLRERSSELRTQCHDAQHRNRQEDYEIALRTANEVVRRLERLIERCED